MAKKSVVERNKKRIRLSEKFSDRRASLKAVTKDVSLSAEERFEAQLKLAQLPLILVNIDSVGHARNSVLNYQSVKTAIFFREDTLRIAHSLILAKNHFFFNAV